MKKAQLKWLSLLVFAGLFNSVLFTNCAPAFKALSLGSSNGSASGSFESLKCTSESRPVAPTDTRRLSKVELVNTLSELLGSSHSGVITSFGSRLPDENTLVSVSKFVNTFADVHVNAISDMALSAANSVTQTDASTNAFLSRYSSCSNYTSVTGDCVHQLISKFGLRVFRRPLSTEEVAGFRSVYDSESEPKNRMHLLVMTLLQSPEFYYHIELGSKGSGTETEFDLTSYEVASRLSYALWDSMPSDSLFQKAQAGELQNPIKLEAVVSEMIEDPRSANKLKKFFSFWLGRSSNPAPSGNPNFVNGLDTNGLFTEMNRELDQFIEHVVWKKRKGYKELLLSKVSFARSAGLAAVYEHPLAKEPDLGTQIMGQGRVGVLLRGPLLYSSDDENHPILRGAKFRTRVLCDELGAPVAADLSKRPDLDTLEAIQALSTRERTAARTSGSCMGCHASINPLGFALEEFDSLGRRRSTERNFDPENNEIAKHHIVTNVDGLSIDPGGRDSIASAQELVEVVANSDKGPSCFARQTFRYFHMRMEDVEADGCALTGIRNAVGGDQGSIVEGLKRTVLNLGLYKKIVKKD